MIRVGYRRLRSGIAAWAAASIGLFGCMPSEDPGPADPAFHPVPSASAEDVRSFVDAAQGGARVRLAYVDRTRKDGRLAFLDFSGTGGPTVPAVPAVQFIAAARDPKVPVISPDGEWIVYASGPGAEAGSALGQRSSVYLVRMRADAEPLLVAADSACEPRFVQAAEGRLEILYTTLAPNLGWEGFGKTLKVAVDVSGESPRIGEPEVLAADGSYTGGLSWDGRYLCGGGGHVAMRDLQDAGGRPDTLSYRGIQSCNASISSSRIATDVMMYLNLYGDHPRLNGGEPWEEWQAILIGGRDGKLRKGYMPPSDPEDSLETEPASLAKVKWHHCEWSNHPHFAAATLNAERYFKSGSGYANTMYQERIYLINLRDSSYLEILRPDRVAYHADEYAGFYWPYVWVEVPPGFAETPGWLDVL